MVEVPAVCNRCGSFYPSGTGFDPGDTGITATWTTRTHPIDRPCPACGGRGRILGGAWGIVENTISLLEGPETTVSELERLAGVLRDARDRGADLAEVRSTVEREVPGLGERLSQLLVPRTPSDLVAYITLMLMIIAMVQEGKQSDRPVEVDQVINNIVVEAPVPSEQQPAGVPTTASDAVRRAEERGMKVSRNRPCPCGSGLKFKKCHGQGGKTHYVGP